MITIEEFFEKYTIINKSKIVSEENEKSIYDMYEIEITYKNGKKEVITVFTEPDTLDIIYNDNNVKKQENIKKWFLVERLFGKNGLINEQGRRDCIYLGKLELNTLGTNYVADNFFETDDKQIAQEKFDSYLKHIKQALGKEQYVSDAPKNEGKNYAIADIHGMYGSYMEVMQSLNNKDNLFILGDVIDRGPNGMKILLDIIQRKKQPLNNPNIEFLMGNHEFMFLAHTRGIRSCLNELQKFNPNINIEELIIRKLEIEKELEIIKSAKQTFETKKDLSITIEKKINIDNKLNSLNRNFYFSQIQLYIDKMQLNGAKETLLDFMKLSNNKKEEVIQFLNDSYIVLPKTIQNDNILFVHAMPPDNSQMLNVMREKQIGFKFKELYNTVEDLPNILHMVQERDNKTFDKSSQHGFLTICGHTYTNGKAVKGNGYINIDGGCGHSYSFSNLILLCIEDKKVKYFKEEAEIPNTNNYDIEREY